MKQEHLQKKSKKENEKAIMYNFNGKITICFFLLIYRIIFSIVTKPAVGSHGHKSILEIILEPVRNRKKLQ